MVKIGPFSRDKSGLKTTSGEFLGMYELDFSCSSIFHQLWTHIGYFKGKKDQLIFSPISAIFYRQADFKTLQQPPKSDSWGFHGGNPSSGTQGSPPNHNWQKNVFKPQNPKSHSQPSVQWTLDQKAIFKTPSERQPSKFVKQWANRSYSMCWINSNYFLF